MELGRQGLAGEEIIHAAAVLRQQAFHVRPQGAAALFDPGCGLQVLLPDVPRQRRGAQYFRQPAVGRPALQVHLEKTVLGVDEADGEEQVAVAAGLDQGHAVRVAFNLHLAGDAGIGQHPFPDRQGGLEKKVGDHGGQQQQGEQGDASGFHDFHGSPFGLL